MRILIFSLAYHPFVGGAEVAIKEITDRTPDVEFDLVTVNLDGQQKQQERLGKVNVHRVGQGKASKYFFPWQGFKVARELHSKNKYDAIWAMMANQAGLAALKFKQKFPDVKYLLTLQEGDSEFDIMVRTWFIRPLYKAIFRRADYIQAISNFLAQRAKNLGAKCPIAVVPNGVVFPAQSTEYQKNRRVVTVSRLVKKNGIADLIKAMKFVSGQLVIVGSGRLKPSLESLTKQFNLTDRVEFIGSVDNQKVYQYLSRSNIFVRPSLSEGLGSAFLEAMAMKVPVIATPVGGIPDFLEDERTGWFCQVNNPKSIAEKINYILNPENAETVGRVVDAAYQMVKEKYQWEGIAAKMKGIFQSL